MKRGRDGARTGGVDHGFREIKWLIRKRLLTMISPSAAVDLYAGRGRIARELYNGFPEIHLVEKDPGKCQSLISMDLSGPCCPEATQNRRVYCMDNFQFADAVLPGIEGVNLLDFDAYGNPHPLVRKVFSRWKPGGRTVIAATDGSRLAIARSGAIRLAAYRAAPPPDHPIALDQQGAMARLDPVVLYHHELLVLGFWKELAREHGFAIKAWLTAWKKGRMVMYYGLCIEPH